MTMHIYIKIGIVVALICIAFVVGIVVLTKYSDKKDKRRKKEDLLASREKQLDAWIVSVEAAGTDEELSKITKPEQWASQWPSTRLDAARKKVREGEFRFKAKAIADEIEQSQTAAAKAFAYFRLLQVSEGNWIPKSFLYLYTPVVNAKFQVSLWFSRALDRAREGNRQEFLSIRGQLPLHSGMWLRFLKYPDDWHNIVSMHLENPTLEDFVFLRGKLPDPGSAQLLAAQALRTSSLIDAKIVLAYCNLKNSDKYRKEVGDVLLADLAKMVDQLHQEQRHFAQLEEKM